MCEWDALARGGFHEKETKNKIFGIVHGVGVGIIDAAVDVHFSSAEDLSSSEAIYFLEGYLKATLKDGKTAESIRGLGMTLMGPMKSDVPLESNMWNWTWSNTSGGEGVLKYNIPLLDEGETQSVETSQATGMSEVNGLQVGDRVTLQNETVVNTSNFPQDIVQELFPNGPSVFSDPVTFVVEDASKYPKTITVGEEEPVQEQKNVALAKYVTSDGKTTASQTVSWPKSQASVDFTPATLAGYSVSPASHTFTKDGEMVTFTYTPNTMDTVADSDVTVIVDYKVPDGYTAPASKKATGKPKTSYSVLTPDIYGLAPSKRVVEGVFSNQNENFTVTYVKTETGMLLDDKTVFCPPDRVFVYDGTARQLIPYSPGYTFEGSSSEVFPGIYTYQLKLNAGWKWSDGTTGTKSVTCAIDKAPLSSVRVSQNQFKDTDGITKPREVYVVANGIVVPPGNYTLTYTVPDVAQPGIYQVTAKALGDTCFVGSASTTYGITETYVLECPTHGQETYFISNGDAVIGADGKATGTHDEICKACERVINRQASCHFDQVVAHGVDDNTHQPVGKLLVRCTSCGQCIYGVACNHPESERIYVDNNDGTHNVICGHCKVVLVTNEKHELESVPVKSKVSGICHSMCSLNFWGICGNI